MFTCPGCDKTVQARDAVVQPDGELRCPDCTADGVGTFSQRVEDPDGGRVRVERIRGDEFGWCRWCGETKPESEFEYVKPADPFAGEKPSGGLSPGLAKAFGVDPDRPRTRREPTVERHEACEACALFAYYGVRDLACERCGDPFRARRKDARFCSPRCRTAASRERAKTA